MARHLVLGGCIGGLLALASSTAMAQEARPAKGDCSGFMCKVFGTWIEDQPPQASLPRQKGSAADGTASGSRAGKARTAQVRKVIPAVTIAAGQGEAARLKALAASLPQTNVHIVKDTDKAADFTVVPVVAGAASSEKARLFTEQLHVVAGPDVQSLADLKGKVVSFGPDKGPAQAAARKAFAALGVAVEESPLELDNALDGLTTGDVAAVAVLAPQPDARLAGVKNKSGLHLVSWPEGVAAPDGASMASIPGSAYPGLASSGDSVRALGVECALNASGKGATTSPAAKAFLVALSQHSAALSKRGFDLIKADNETRTGRRVASVERH